MRKQWIGVLGLVFLAGCSAGTTVGTILPTPTAASLRAVPSRVEVFGKTLIGETNVWRNMMPTVVLAGEPQPKRGIIVSITIKAEDGAMVPGGLRAERVSVAKGDEVWTTTAVETQRDEVSFGATVRNGPEWDGDSTVDVVANFRDSVGGLYQLRAPGKVVLNAF